MTRKCSIVIVFCALLSGCAHDVVLPSEGGDSCGNLRLDPGEQCDNTSPGCRQCKVVPGWSCQNNSCSTLCGDGIVGGADGSCEKGTKVESCDMNGYWLARQTDFSRDAVLSSLQTSSTWYVYKISQRGSGFTIESSLNCGVTVSGTVTVQLTIGSQKAFLYSNKQDGGGVRAARLGSFQQEGNGCSFQMQRWYSVRGVDDSFLPTDFAKLPSLADLPALPKAENPTKPSQTLLPGTNDPDGDGYPGISFKITGIANGIRNSAQRDTSVFATETGKPVSAHAVEFTIPGSFDSQEEVLAVTDCGSLCSVMTLPGRAATDLKSRLTLRFLGRSANSPRVSSILVATPGTKVESDLETCARVRESFPHDATPP